MVFTTFSIYCKRLLLLQLAFLSDMHCNEILYTSYTLITSDCTLSDSVTTRRSDRGPYIEAPKDRPPPDSPPPLPVSP